MPLAPMTQEEADALRSLEEAVRACGLPTIMVSGQEQLDRLADALRAIERARQAASRPLVSPAG